MTYGSYCVVIKRLKRVFRSLVLLGILGLTLGLIGMTSLYFFVKPDLPSVESLRDVRLQTPMRIYTQDGLLISQYGVKRRIPVTLDNVPQTLIDAILATEDSRFYEHKGIDPIGMLRALMNLVVTGEKGQGGSTLTMQIARGFYLSREKTYIRKIKEIFIAWHIEQTLTKDEILTLYLNKVELGHRAFGFGAAAQVYYGSTLNELNLAQLATLAGLPKAPSVLNPISKPERSIERRRVVLLRMLDEGYITRQEFRLARDAQVTAQKHGAEIEFSAPYLADIIYNEMVDLYGKEEAETGGYKVYATVDSTLQRAAQNAVVQNIHDYDERHGYRGVLTNVNELHELWQFENNIEPTKVIHDLEGDKTLDKTNKDNSNITDYCDFDELELFSDDSSKFMDLIPTTEDIKSIDVDFENSISLEKNDDFIINEIIKEDEEVIINDDEQTSLTFDLPISQTDKNKNEKQDLEIFRLDDNINDIEIDDYIELIPVTDTVPEGEEKYTFNDHIILEQTDKEYNGVFDSPKTISEEHGVEPEITLKKVVIKEKHVSTKKDDFVDPFNSPISKILRDRTDDRRRTLKAYNYKFNPSKIEDFEKEPAYKRQGVELNDFNESNENKISRTSISQDENDDMQVRSNNSFLHDNVD